ncbi:hypothetical protein SM007_33035 [Streptomyces avermitilis]|nr:hypothetical protein SM007_33035 [Streptomyces avermitilis]
MTSVADIEELLNRHGGWAAGDEAGTRSARNRQGIPHSILTIDQMPAEPWEGRAACASVPRPPDAIS